MKLKSPQVLAGATLALALVTTQAATAQPKSQAKSAKPQANTQQARIADPEARAAIERIEKTKKFSGLPDVAAIVALSPAQHLVAAELQFQQASGERYVAPSLLASSIEGRLELGREVIKNGGASTRFVPAPFWQSQAATYIARKTGGARAAQAKTEAHMLLSSYGLPALYAGLKSSDRHFVTEANLVGIDDIADVMAAAALFSYAAGGKEIDFMTDDTGRMPKDIAKSQAVRAQMKKRVLADEALQGGENIHRRFVAELFQILTMHTMAAGSDYGTKSGTPASRKAAQAKALADSRLIFKYATGLDIDKAALSSEGFVTAG